MLWITRIRVFHSKSQKRQLLNSSTFKCIFMLKVRVKILHSNPRQVLSSHSNLLLPPNPTWSQLEAFSVPSLVSTLFAVPVCNEPVQWDTKVMFYFTQNLIQLDELSPASQNNKKWLEICNKQIVVEKCIYVFRRLKGIK